MMNHAHKIKEELLWVLLFIASIWIIFLLDWFLPLENLGLVPRTFSGIFGIVTMPFLHADLAHLMSNTVPLVVLLTLLAGSKANSALIVVSITLLAGLLLWLFGRGDALHIGASGLVFGLAVFLILSGLLERRTIPMIISFVVAAMYGSTLLSGIAPWQKGVSWDGHLLGGIAGAITAWILIKHIRRN